MKLLFTLPVIMITFAGCSLYKSSGRKAYESAPLSSFNFASTACYDSQTQEIFSWEHLTEEEKNSFQVISQQDSQWLAQSQLNGSQCWLKPQP